MNHIRTGFLKNRDNFYNRTLKIKGFTLVEVIVTVALVSVVFAAIFSFFFFQTSTYSHGSDKSQIQTEIRLASDFISKELRYATKVSVATPSDSSLYNRLYIQDNKLMFQPAGGTAIEKSSDIFDPADFSVDIAGIGGEFIINYSLHGTKNKSDYTIRSSVVMKNISTTNNENGNQIYYQLPVALSSTTPTSTPTSEPTTPTSSPTTAIPTPAPIKLVIDPSIPSNVTKGTTSEYILTASGGDGSYQFNYSYTGWTLVDDPASNGKKIKLTAPSGNGKNLAFSVTIKSNGVSETFGPYLSLTVN